MKLFKYPASISLIAVLIVVFSIYKIPALTSNDASEADSINQLKRTFFSMEYNQAVSDGKMMADRFTNSSQIKAWLILSAVRNDEQRGYIDNIFSTLTENDPWKKFALIGTRMWTKNFGDQDLIESKSLLDMAPNNPDFIWIRSEVLRLRGLKDEALTVLDGNPKVLNESPELLLAKGSALYDLWRLNKTNLSLKNEASAVFSKAKLLSPDYIRVNYVPAWYFLVDDAPEQSIKLLEEIIQNSTSVNVHTVYWSAIQRSAELSFEGKKAKFIQDAELIEKKWRHYPKGLYELSKKYEEYGEDKKQKYCEEIITNEYSNSAIADFLDMDKVDRLTPRIATDAIARNEQILILKKYIDRVTKRNASDLTDLGNAYVKLLEVYRKDESVKSEDFLAATQAVNLYFRGGIEISHYETSLALTERNLYPNIAEQYAKNGFSELDNFIERNKRTFESGVAEDEFRSTMEGKLARALAIAYFRQNKFEDSKNEFLKSIQTFPEPESYYYLAKIYLNENAYSAAEAILVSGLKLRSGASDSFRLKSFDLLRSIYASRNGNLSGYNEYIAKLDRNIVQEKASVLKNNMAAIPEDFKPIAAINSSGELINTAMYKGKPIILNFWTLSCRICVEELPSLSALDDMYKNNKDVVVLNINLDFDRNIVNRYLEKNGLTINFVLASKNIDRNLIARVPMMIALDREGKLRYQHIGLNRNLIEDSAILMSLLDAHDITKN